MLPCAEDAFTLAIQLIGTLPKAGWLACIEVAARTAGFRFSLRCKSVLVLTLKVSPRALGIYGGVSPG